MGRARATAALLLCLTSACADGARQPAPTPTLEAELTQYRRDAALRQVQLKLANHGQVDVVVERLRLEAPGFATEPDVDEEARLPPGRRVDLPVPYGRARCDDGPPSTAGPTDGTAVAVVRVAQGPPREVRLPLPAAGGLLRRLHERDCAQQRLAAAVDVSFAPDWPEGVSAGGPALQPTLVLRRRAGTDTVVVDDVGGHVLLTVRPRPDRPRPLLVLAAGEQVAELPLELVATRCDPHALAESKRTPLLGFYVAVGDDEPRLTFFQADAAATRRLTEFVTRSCLGR